MLASGELTPLKLLLCLVEPVWEEDVIVSCAKTARNRTVAVTPTKAQSMDPAQVKRVCHDYTMAGLKAMHEAGPAKPFRFLYMSGNNAVRDPARRPRILGDYCVMRVSYTT